MTTAAQLIKVFLSMIIYKLLSVQWIHPISNCVFLFAACFTRAWWKEPDSCFWGCWPW